MSEKKSPSRIQEKQAALSFAIHRRSPGTRREMNEDLQARQPKTREALQASAQTLADIAAGCSRFPLPQSTVILQDIIKALLSRIYRENRRKSIELARIINEIALIERGALQKNPPGVVLLVHWLGGYKGIHRSIDTLATGRLGRKHHFLPTLELQRLLLEKRLTEGDARSFPFQIKNPRAQQLWFKEKAPEKLLNSLSTFRCVCDVPAYPQTFKHLTLAKPLKTQSQLVDAILAYLHRTTPAQIKKLFKPSSRK